MVIKMTQLARRRFCQSVLGLAGLSILPSCSLQREQQFVSAYSNTDGQHFVAVFNQSGEVFSEVEIPLRGHDIAISHKEPFRVIAFSRRPGAYLYDIDLNKGVIKQTIKANDGRHFFGHGVFSPDGQYLFTTENDYHNQQGKVVVRDAQSLAVIKEFNSGGVGPHQLAWLNDGKTLVIANGGIATHPDTPREKLNVLTMAPNLTYLQSESGTILQQFYPPHHQLSIRHLAVDRRNKENIAMQYQGPKSDLHPLVYSQQGDGPMVACTASDLLWQQMHQYTASVCIDDAVNVAAVSCPRSGFVSFWDLRTDRLIDTFQIRDCAGVTLSKDGFLLSNGKGEIACIDPFLETASSKMQLTGYKWDNHMQSLKESLF